MKISIIIPAYNEERRIGKTLEEYGKFFKNLKTRDKIEILVVINGTTDRTEDVVKEFARKYKIIRYINLKPGDKGFAVMEGFKHAVDSKFDLIGFVDADMSTLPEDYYQLIKNIGRYDGVIGGRWLNESKTKRSIRKRITSRGFNFIVRSLFLLPYQDTQCGAKIFKREVLEKIVHDLKLTKWAFDVNLLYLCKKNNFKIREFPTIWIDKEDSKITDILRVTIQMFLGVVRLRAIYSPIKYFRVPLKGILNLGDKLINKK